MGNQVDIHRFNHQHPPDKEEVTCRSSELLEDVVSTAAHSKNCNIFYQDGPDHDNIAAESDGRFTKTFYAPPISTDVYLDRSLTLSLSSSLDSDVASSAGSSSSSEADDEDSGSEWSDSESLISASDSDSEDDVGHDVGRIGWCPSETLESDNEKEEQENSHNGKCEICLDTSKNTAFVPCGHGACTRCSAQLTNCHICRTMIQSRLRLYL